MIWVVLVAATIVLILHALLFPGEWYVYGLGGYHLAEVRRARQRILIHSAIVIAIWTPYMIYLMLPGDGK